MEFVAGVSHELRTPVAVIRSAAENLAHGVVPAGERVQRYGEMIEGEARRLGDMVERVLQYAGIESGLGMTARTPLAPADLVDDAIDAAMPALGGAEIHREVEAGLPPVVGDGAALRSAIQNLIVNAAKYGLPGEAGRHGSDHGLPAEAGSTGNAGSGNGPSVSVRAERVVERRRPHVRFSVDDRGRGIPAAELPHIFEPFYRGADAIARQIQGSGLGLSLVARIVAAHGGRVSVNSQPGRTTFAILLPAADGDVHERAAAPSGRRVEGAAHS
jgi:signal transduction histidine kinase